MSKNIAVIFAGGVGSRMGTNDLPKQFLSIEDKPIIIHTIEIFEEHPEIDEIYVACLEEWIGHLMNLLKLHSIKKVKEVFPGGETPLHSIYNALIKIKENTNADDTVVLLHDGVRPYLDYSVITDNITGVKEHGNAITTTPSFETVLISEDGDKVTSVPLRKNMFAGQAPQSFLLGELLDAHEQIRKTKPNYEEIVDSCTMYHLLGKPVHMVRGNFGNIKVTTERDYYILLGLLEYARSGDFNELVDEQKKEIQKTFKPYRKRY